MISVLMKGIIRGGRVEVAEPIDLPDGSEVTIAGCQDAAPFSSSAPFTAPNWNESRNERRCALIRKKFARGIDAAESGELAELQEELAIYRKSATPLPYDVLDELRSALNAPTAPMS